MRWLFLLLLMALPLKADYYLGAAAQPAAGGACNTTNLSSSGVDNSGLSNLDFTWHAAPFTATNTATVCTIHLTLEKDGTPPDGTMTASIYTASGDNPGTLVGTASATVAISSLADAAGTVVFTGVNASIVNATDYYVVWKCSVTGSAGTPNNVAIWRNWENTGKEHTVSDNSGGSWTDVDNSWPKFTIITTGP